MGSLGEVNEGVEDIRNESKRNLLKGGLVKGRFRRSKCPGRYINQSVRSVGNTQETVGRIIRNLGDPQFITNNKRFHFSLSNGIFN